MALGVDEFAHELLQEVVTEADAAGHLVEDIFFDKFCGFLTESGELDTADRAFFKNASNTVRVDGYGGDPAASGGTLTLIIADCNQTGGVSSFNRAEMESLVAKPFRFVREALKTKWRNSLEETGPAFGLADLVAQRWSKTNRVRIILISNRELRVHVDGIEADELDGRTVTYSVWDISRLHRNAGRGSDEISIDLENDFGGAIALLPAHLATDDYEAYLAVVPAKVLAEIYDRWGARLLEQNVRVFLQARGNVNKGIRNTILNDPSMFFAYNNGITATAEAVVTEVQNGQLVATKLENLQIVNGGQTTASIHVAFRNKADLSHVFVQMKLSIVAAERTEEVVPKISEYANSQNRVNAADFFANHPFHVRIESFSRRIFAPSPDGTFRETKWFYERARGQFADARSLLTPAQLRKHDLEHPRAQLVSKTDLAKFLNVWECHPDKVSLGAQKNFAHFAHAVGVAWKKSEDGFNEAWYREAIAKAIVFKSTEKIVSSQPWYEGGYRANIVAYSIAKIAWDLTAQKRSVDFSKIWKAQAISDAFTDQLARVAKAVTEILTNPPSGISNVTEWAKKQACWARVKDVQVEYLESFLSALISAEEKKSEVRTAKREQRVLNGIEAQTAVVNAGGPFWSEALAWGRSKRALSESEDGILATCSLIPRKVPSEKQSERALEALEKLNTEGYEPRIT